MGRYSATCLKIMRQAKVSARKYPPSSIEIAVSSVIYLSRGGWGGEEGQWGQLKPMSYPFTFFNLF